MRKLLVLRHAATEQNLDADDFERKLLQKGVGDCHKLHNKLSKYGFKPDLILASNSVRTTTTAELVFPEIKAKLVPDLYRADSSYILDIIETIDSKYNSLVIIGHNPGVSDFCRGFISNLDSKYLLDIQSGMNPLAAALFVLPDSTKWSEVRKVGGELSWYFNP